MGTTTSLTSGLPSRDTWTYGPETTSVPFDAFRTRAFWRLAVVQTPITEAAELASEGAAPFLDSWVFGSWRAIECTFTPLVEFTPAAMLPIPVFASPNVAWSCSKGRRLAR